MIGMIGGIIFFLTLGSGLLFIITTFTVKENRPDKEDSIILTFKRFKMLYELDPENWELWTHPRYKVEQPCEEIAGDSRKIIWTRTEWRPVYFNRWYDVLRYINFLSKIQKQNAEKKQLSIQQEFLDTVNKRLKTEKDIARENMEKAIATYEKIKEVLADE